MKTVIGIDVGGSTTKIVAFRCDKKTKEYKLIEPQLVKANDPITATYGAFGKFTDENNLKFSDITKVMMTGVGSAYVRKNLYGLDCERVEEFNSIGRGGLYLSGLSEALVVSMGTGTAMVHARSDGAMNYLGGTGVGGGTLMGLSKLLLKAESVEHIVEYAREGDLANIDLRIKDMTAEDSLSALSRDLTAANFGNVSDIAEKSDISKGIMNLVFETVGMISIFAARSVGVRDIVLTGNITQLEYCREKFNEFNNMGYGVRFHIPERSRYATVIGTALRGIDAEESAE
ncbi:MAG: pantothenate kinase [Clostridia bacterium]|nr:pantothenate kinase [Clostridia bacterium]